jgi:hypothetical protein
MVTVISAAEFYFRSTALNRLLARMEGRVPYRKNLH